MIPHCAGLCNSEWHHIDCTLLGLQKEWVPDAVVALWGQKPTRFLAETPISRVTAKKVADLPISIILRNYGFQRQLVRIADTALSAATRIFANVHCAQEFTELLLLYKTSKKCMMKSRTCWPSVGTIGSAMGAATSWQNMERMYTDLALYIYG